MLGVPLSTAATGDDSGVRQLGFFIETSRWLGIKVRLAALNTLNSIGTRDRTVFVDERDMSPVEFRELRARARDRSMTEILRASQQKLRSQDSSADGGPGHPQCSTSTDQRRQ